MLQSAPCLAHNNMYINKQNTRDCDMGQVLSVSTWQLAGKTSMVVTFITEGLDTVQRYPAIRSCSHKQAPLKCLLSFKFSFLEITSLILI